MPVWLDRILERRVLRALSSWREPALVLRGPDGGERRFGRPEGPSVEVDVHSPAFYRRLALGGDAGPGESFVAGEWSSPDLVALLSAFLVNRRLLSLSGPWSAPIQMASRLRLLLRRNDRRGSERHIHAHYDLGNDFFRLFLDPSLTYSSAMFPSPDSSLAEAQTHKYAAICSKLRLCKEDRVLEIGSGWGGFALHAASEIGCKVTTITISRKQYDYLRDIATGRGGLVDVRYCDYRDVEGYYDKIVSIEMLEAVGRRYWDVFFARIERLLAPRGLALLQVICVPDQRFQAYRRGSDWVRKHVFPGGLLPSLFELLRSIRRSSRLELHDLEEIGSHYARTLHSWRERFWENVASVRRLGFDESFVRLWDFYLASCEAGFATHCNRDLQLVLTRPENPLLGAGATDRALRRFLPGPP